MLAHLDLLSSSSWLAAARGWTGVLTTFTRSHTHTRTHTHKSTQRTVSKWQIKQNPLQLLKAPTKQHQRPLSTAPKSWSSVCFGLCRCRRTSLAESVPFSASILIKNYNAPAITDELGIRDGFRRLLDK